MEDKYTAVVLLDKAWEQVKQQLQAFRFCDPSIYSQICAADMKNASLCNIS